MHHGNVESLFTAKRCIALEHGIHHTTEGIDVATSVEFFALRLLWAHVFGRSANDATARDLLGALGTADDFCQAEIDDFDAKMGSRIVHDKDVFGLEIAMDNPLLMRLRQAPANLERHARRRNRRQSAFNAHDFS